VVSDATGLIIEDCDFSDNFHDPTFGWGENCRRGGIVLERVLRSTLRRNRANRVWDGCVLVDCEGNLLEDNDFSHVFTRPGFHRLGLTVSNGPFSDLAWRDLYVIDDGKEIGTEGRSREWGWIDPQSRVGFSDDAQTRLCGRSSIFAHVQPYLGGRVSLLYPRTERAGWPLRGLSRIVFWVKAINENTVGWQETNPVVTLHDVTGRSVILTPKADFLSRRPNNEERQGWTRFEIPLAGDAQWSKKGAEIATVDYLTLGFDSWGASPLRIWIDGLSFQ
jgi:parallel beta-helix repeat protein